MIILWKSLQNNTYKTQRWTSLDEINQMKFSPIYKQRHNQPAAINAQCVPNTCIPQHSHHTNVGPLNPRPPLV